MRPPPPGLTDLRAALPHAIFEIAYATPDNFTGAPLAGYEAPGAWLRDRAAAALVRAAAALEAEGLGVVLFDAYRPVRATEAMWAWAQRVGRTDLFTDGWIARPSRHNRAIAVDLGLWELRSGARVDMGSPFDAFTPESHVRGVGGAALTARLRLRRALVDEGFTPLESEWWHFEHADPDAGLLDLPYGP